MVAVRVTGSAGNRDVLARIDSGADDTMFPTALVAALGLTGLTEPLAIGGVGGATLARFGTVDLESGDGQMIYRWSDYVGFSNHPLPVLGLKGFLQFFTAKFHGRRRYLELVPNNLAAPPSFPIT